MIRPLALLLTFLTGFSGLVYEVAWQKYLASLLGSQSEATAAVLGLYLGGLALGYAVFGRVAERMVLRASRAGKAPPLLRLYGVVEASIGLYAIAFPLLFSAAERISFLAPLGNEAIAFSFDIVLSAFLLVPPTVLMGGTIPLLTQALARTLDDATRVHAWIYASNTAGAFVGSLAGAFVLLPLLGLDGALFAMGGVNLVAGSTFLVMNRAASRTLLAPGAEGASVTPPRAARFAGFAAVALLSGFAMMALQTVFNRIGGLAFGASHYTFAMIVAVFVLCIALGSSVVSSLSRIPRSLLVVSQWALVGLLALLYFELQNAPYYAHVVRVMFRDIPEGFYPYQFACFLGLLAVLALPIGLSGALLPLLFHQLRHEVGDLGGIAGKLYSWNTLGSLFGALLGGYVLLFWVDLQEVYAVALAAVVIGAGLLTFLLLDIPVLASVLATVVALGGVVALPDWDTSRIGAGRFRSRSPDSLVFEGPDAYFAGNNQAGVLRFYDDDPVNSAAVFEAALGKSGKPAPSIFNNGKSDGHAEADYPTMCFLAALPALVTDDASNSFVVGWGTGVSAGELATLPETERVTVAEISQGVLAARPLFDPWNQNASKSPKVKVLRSDAYRALLRTDERFGIIVSEPSNPWVTGVEMLYSQDFLRAARQRLTPGGVYAQWFHLYELDFETVEIVAHTYASVFDTVAVWFSTGPDLILLGFNSDQGYPDAETIRQRYEAPALHASFDRCGATSLPQVLAHEILPPGVLNAAEYEGPIHSVRHPLLSHHAARAFFSGNSATLPRIAKPKKKVAVTSLLASLFPVADFDDARFAEITEHVCAMHSHVECAGWFGRWIAGFPKSPAQSALLDRFREDSRPYLASKALASLAALHRGELPASMEGTDPQQRAEAITRMFARYYVHAIPFEPRIVGRAWSACSASGGGRAAIPCSQRRRALEPLLSSFTATD